jgi:hypothetical protein
MAETPAPADPFAGAEQRTEEEKRKLVQDIAQRGAYAGSQLANRAQAAQGLAGAAPGMAPGAPVQADANTRALYDVFNRDAAESQAQHGQEMQRITAANEAYMSQVGAGIGALRLDNQAYTDAQRRAYEDREKDRQAQLAAQRASSRSSSSSAKAILSPEQKAQEDHRYNTEAAKLSAQGKAATQLRPSEVAATGQAAQGLNRQKAFSAFGLQDPLQMTGLSQASARYKDPKAAKTFNGYSQYVQAALASAAAEDLSYEEVVANFKDDLRNNKDAFAQFGVAPSASDFERWLKPLMAMYGNAWGTAAVPAAKK